MDDIMTTTWTNPETANPMPVFVHAALEENGKSLLLVNKGCAKTFATFLVRVTDTNVVMA